MQKRPISLTIVAWLFIIASFVTAILTILAANSPITQELMKSSPVSLTMAVIVQVIAIIVNVIIGVGILRRSSWARQLYVGSTILGLLFTSATTQALAIVPGVLAGLAFTYILYRGPASEYFGSVAGTNSLQSPSPADTGMSKAA